MKNLMGVILIGQWL